MQTTVLVLLVTATLAASASLPFGVNNGKQKGNSLKRILQLVDAALKVQSEKRVDGPGGGPTLNAKDKRVDGPGGGPTLNVKDFDRNDAPTLQDLLANTRRNYQDTEKRVDGPGGGPTLNAKEKRVDGPGGGPTLNAKDKRVDGPGGGPTLNAKDKSVDGPGGGPTLNAKALLEALKRILSS